MIDRLRRWIGRDRARTAEDLASARLREALDFIPEGIAFYDAQDRIVTWNARYAELVEDDGWLMKGASFRELLEAGLRNGIYPEAAGREAEWMENRLAFRRADRSALEQENKGRWLRIIERRTADGGVVSICEDITELKRREASLRLIFEGSPVPMWVVDVETWGFLAVNEAAVSQYGYSREQFLAMKVFELYAPEEIENLRRESKVADAQGFYRSARAWKQKRANGSELLVTPFLNYIRYDNRAAVMAAQFDVTVSKRAEEAMAAARDQAEAANRAKSEFLANMSHEIRTPLNGVLGLVGVLGNTELSDGQAEMVRIIQSSAQTLERLLRDLLDFARVEAGRVEIEREPFDLGQTLRSAAALFAAEAQGKGLALRLDIAPGADRRVEGDEHRLKQIVTNLLSNAVKFTAAGSVTLRARAEGGRVSVEVEDTGVGFNPDCKEKLFARFQQEDGSVTRRFGGSGLGLSISRQLAELMGGRLDARSELGRGSVFTLELPLVPVKTAGGAEAGRRLRILLADDHPTNRKVVELMLHAVDAELTCVEDGERAVAAALADRFDLILMDMQMPVMDGLSAIREIRRRERAAGTPPTPIYTLSAHAMDAHAAEALAAGADRHMTKPLKAAELIGALAELSGAPSQAAA